AGGDFRHAAAQQTQSAHDVVADIITADHDGDDHARHGDGNEQHSPVGDGARSVASRRLGRVLVVRHQRGDRPLEVVGKVAVFGKPVLTGCGGVELATAQLKDIVVGAPVL